MTPLTTNLMTCLDRLRQDEEFRQRMQANPRQTLEESGIQLADGEVPETAVLPTVDDIGRLLDDVVALRARQPLGDRALAQYSPLGFRPVAQYSPLGFRPVAQYSPLGFRPVAQYSPLGYRPVAQYSPLGFRPVT